MNTSVKFELAKPLKEKGFDKKGCLEEKWLGNKYVGKKEIPVFGISRTSVLPTIADVVMWLYEKHGIYIQVISKNVSNQMSFRFELKRFQWDSCVSDSILYNSPTEAYSAGIEYTLKKLIK